MSYSTSGRFSGCRLVVFLVLLASFLMFSPVAARDIQQLQRRWYLEVRQDRNDTQSRVEGSSSVAADRAASTSYTATSSLSVSALAETGLTSSSTVSSALVAQSSSSVAFSSAISSEKSATSSSSSSTQSTTSASTSSPSSSSTTSVLSTSSSFSTSSILSVSSLPISSSAPLTSASPTSTISRLNINTAAIADTDPVTTLSGGAVSASTTVTRVSSASEPSSTVSNGVVGASSNSFWSNKSAVAGTFAVVGLVSLAIIAGIVMFIIRMRRRQSYDDDFTYPVTDKWSPEPGLRRSASPDPSLSEPPMDVFANREVFANNYSSTHGATPTISPGNYFNTDAPQQFVQHTHSNQSQYYDANISHNYGPGSTPDIIYTYAADVDRQYPVYPGDSGASSTQVSSGRPSPSQHPSTTPSPQQRYSNPFKDNVTGLAVPPAEPVDRASVSASSIDSFYGANSTTPGVAL